MPAHCGVVAFAFSGVEKEGAKRSRVLA